MEVREGQDNNKTSLGMPTTLAFNTRNHSSSPLLLHHHHHVNHTLIFNNPQTLEPFYQPQQPNQSTPLKLSISPNPNPNPNSNSNPNLSPKPSAASKVVPRYRECLKNHAACSGGQVLDGCGEYMPSGEGLNCAACKCHRNFHRKETEGDDQHNTEKCSRRKNAQSQNAALPQPSDPHQHRKLATPNSSPALFRSEDLKDMDKMHGEAKQGGSSRKRFRTKFSEEQKGKMTEAAERLGWKIKKGDEDEVEELCKELGVKSRAFKVWMNSKQAIKKKQML